MAPLRCAQGDTTSHRLSACPPVRLSALPRERLWQPTVHGKNRSRGEAELVAREQDGEVGDGLGRDEPYAQHVARAVRLQLLLFAQAAAGRPALHEVAEHRSVHLVRVDGVYPNSIGT